jgi:peptidoglycan hydrolase-like protein with peptidoglycan-binding domain
MKKMLPWLIIAVIVSVCVASGYWIVKNTLNKDDTNIEETVAEKSEDKVSITITDNAEEKTAPETDLSVERLVETLKKGSEGHQVKILQAKLKRLGIWKDEISGCFGDTLEEAVKRIQRENNLVVDGIVGLKTRSLLNGDPSPTTAPEVKTVTVEKVVIQKEVDKEALKELEKKIEDLTNELKNVQTTPTPTPQPIEGASLSVINIREMSESGMSFIDIYLKVEGSTGGLTVKKYTVKIDGVLQPWNNWIGSQSDTNVFRMERPTVQKNVIAVVELSNGTRLESKIYKFPQ